MSPAAKKSATKPSAKTNGPTGKSHALHHPSYMEMVKQAIIEQSDDHRSGVSRPEIKKFLAAKYHIEINPVAATQLNKAITHGKQKGVFSLPKGPSGKVKLAKGSTKVTAAKENTKPASKRATITKVATKAARPVGRPPKSAAAKTTRAPAKPVAAATPPKAPAKKSPVRKSTATTAKTAAAKKTTGTTRKTTTTSRRGATKKATTGSQKPTRRPKSRAVKTRAANAKQSKPKKA